MIISLILAVLVARLLHPHGVNFGLRSPQFQIWPVGSILLALLVLATAAVAALAYFWPE